MVVNEGYEPENFFWVVLGGKGPYETVSRMKLVKMLIIQKGHFLGTAVSNFSSIDLSGNID